MVIRHTSPWCRCGQWERWGPTMRNWLPITHSLLDSGQFFICFKCLRILLSIFLNFVIGLLLQSTGCVVPLRPGRNYGHSWCFWLRKDCYLSVAVEVLKQWHCCLCGMWWERKRDVWGAQGFPRGLTVFSFDVQWLGFKSWYSPII